MDAQSESDTIDEVSVCSDVTLVYTAQDVGMKSGNERMGEQDLDEPAWSEKVSKHNNGGANNVQTYSEKAKCVDRDVILNDLLTKKCTCKNLCLKKMAAHGQKACQVIKSLRRERFAGTFHARPHT